MTEVKTNIKWNAVLDQRVRDWVLGIVKDIDSRILTADEKIKAITDRIISERERIGIEEGHLYYASVYAGYILKGNTEKRTEFIDGIFELISLLSKQPKKALEEFKDCSVFEMRKDDKGNTIVTFPLIQIEAYYNSAGIFFAIENIKT